jgi:serine/threonine protein kinase
MAVAILPLGLVVLVLYRSQGNARPVTSSQQTFSPALPQSAHQQVPILSAPGVQTPHPLRSAAPPQPSQSSVPSSNAAGSDRLIGLRYRLVRVLGEGGMKRVFEAEDTRLNNRQCVVAELLDATTDQAQHQVNRAAFEREADLLLELDNEYIPKVFDRFSDGNLHYLVMELVPGTTLEQCVANAGGKIDQKPAIEFARQILSALHYLHSLAPPIVFRDLKPDNVMVTPERRIKLIDFGIARHFTKARGTMIGTQGYAAPEQYRGKVDPRSDIYAFGALMHRILSGRDPQSEPPFSFPPLISLCPAIAPHLAQLIDRCLSLDAEKRPRSALEIVTEIEAIASPKSASARNSRPVKPHVRFCTQCGKPLPHQGACKNCGAARFRI